MKTITPGAGKAQSEGTAPAVALDVRDSIGKDNTVFSIAWQITKGSFPLSAVVLLVRLAFRTLVHRSAAWQAWLPKDKEGKPITATKAVDVTFAQFLLAVEESTFQGEANDNTPNASDKREAKAFFKLREDTPETWEKLEAFILKKYNRKLASKDLDGLADHFRLIRLASRIELD